MSSKKIRILLLDTGHEWGGGTNSMIELLKRLDRKRFSVVCCFYKDYRKGKEGALLSEELARIEVPLMVLPQPTQPIWAKISKELVRGLLRPLPRQRALAVFAIDRRWRIAPMAARLTAVLRAGGFDLLYMNNQPSSNLEGYLAAKEAKVPVIQHCRIETQLNEAEIAIVNQCARRIICVSHGVSASLREQGICKSLLTVIPNGIDTDQQLPGPLKLDWLPPSGFVVGTVGQLVRRKSVSDLLRAIALIKMEEGLSFHALIVGEGPEATRLRALADELNIGDRTHFVGFQTEPLRWIAAMDVFVTASAREGLPRVLLEAMLLRKPVIAADAVGSNELVVNNVTGVLYPYGDVRALANAIIRLYREPALRAQMGTAGRERVHREYSISNYVEGVQDCLWEEACSGSC